MAGDGLDGLGVGGFGFEHHFGVDSLQVRRMDEGQVRPIACTLRCCGCIVHDDHAEAS